MLIDRSKAWVRKNNTFLGCSSPLSYKCNRFLMLKTHDDTQEDSSLGKGELGHSIFFSSYLHIRVLNECSDNRKMAIPD